MQKITYQQQPGITYEQELELLASVYRLALESYSKRKAAEQSGLTTSCPEQLQGDQAKKKSDPSTAPGDLKLKNEEGRPA
jgi:hypothetical protein